MFSWEGFFPMDMVNRIQILECWNLEINYLEILKF